MSYKYLKGVLLLVGLGLGSEAYAAGCEFTSNFTGTQDVTMNLGAVIVRPDSEVGSILLEKKFPISTMEKAVKCRPFSLFPLRAAQRDVVEGVLSNSPQPTNYDDVYTTNIPGIGMSLYREVVSSGSGGLQSTFYPHQYNIGPPSTDYDLGGGSFVVRIVKTANTTGTGKIAQGKYSSYHLRSKIDKPILTSHVYGDSITITTSSCEISDAKDKVVQLPTVANTGFNGIGSTQGPQPFDINIKCVGGQNLQQPEKISLSFDYDAANGTNNVLKNLAPDNIKAKGVGTQLVVKEPGVNKAIIKQEKVTVGNLNSEQQITYNLPLEARYYQTEATVTAGEVKSMATVTIQYD